MVGGTKRTFSAADTLFLRVSLILLACVSIAFEEGVCSDDKDDRLMAALADRRRSDTCTERSFGESTKGETTSRVAVAVSIGVIWALSR